MTRPSPLRLPELAGMTEAGFNRVVAMITHREFMKPVPWELQPWSDEQFRAEQERAEWHASLPKVRNKKQRKADAKRAALHERARETFFELAVSVPVVDGSLAARPDLLTPTPLQRLMRFAAEDGTPVSFEIAEAARKGEW